MHENWIRPERIPALRLVPFTGIGAEVFGNLSGTFTKASARGCAGMKHSVAAPLHPPAAMSAAE